MKSLMKRAMLAMVLVGLSTSVWSKDLKGRPLSAEEASSRIETREMNGTPLKFLDADKFASYHYAVGINYDRQIIRFKDTIPMQMMVANVFYLRPQKSELDSSFFCRVDIGDYNTVVGDKTFQNLKWETHYPFDKPRGWKGHPAVLINPNNFLSLSGMDKCVINDVPYDLALIAVPIYSNGQVKSIGIIAFDLTER